MISAPPLPSLASRGIITVTFTSAPNTSVVLYLLIASCPECTKSLRPCSCCLCHACPWTRKTSSVSSASPLPLLLQLQLQPRFLQRRTSFDLHQHLYRPSLATTRSHVRREDEILCRGVARHSPACAPDCQPRGAEAPARGAIFPSCSIHCVGQLNPNMHDTKY